MPVLLLILPKSWLKFILYFLNQKFLNYKDLLVFDKFLKHNQLIFLLIQPSILFIFLYKNQIFSKLHLCICYKVQYFFLTLFLLLSYLSYFYEFL